MMSLLCLGCGCEIPAYNKAWVCDDCKVRLSKKYPSLIWEADQVNEDLMRLPTHLVVKPTTKSIQSTHSPLTTLTVDQVLDDIDNQGIPEEWR